MKKTPSSQSAFFVLRVAAALFFCLSGMLLALVGFGAFSNLFAQTKPSLAARGEKSVKTINYSRADKNGRFVYLIKFAEPGMLYRRGRAADERFNPDAPGAKANRVRVMAEQAALVQAMSRALGRKVEVTHYFLVTHSGIAARFTRKEAQIVKKLPGVVSVERERLYNLTTFRGPTFTRLSRKPSVESERLGAEATGTAPRRDRSHAAAAKA